MAEIRDESGLPILDTVTRACVVERIGRFQFRIILTQGLNRQIRRMCEYLGFEVTELVRVRIMNIHLDMPIGSWRLLNDAEIAEIHRLVADSAKVADLHFQQDEE